MGKKLSTFKILMILVCIFSISRTAVAENSLISTAPSKTYENLMKSFIMRVPTNQGYLYTPTILQFRDTLVDVLALTYAYSELKAHRSIPENLKQHFEINTEAEILSRLAVSFKKAKQIAQHSTAYRFSVVNNATMLALQVAAQTLTEFAPFMNIKDKNLRAVLVEGFEVVLTSLSGQVALHETKYNDSWKPVRITIQQMNKALAPPNLLQQMIDKVRTQTRPRLYQYETAPICHKLFQ